MHLASSRKRSERHDTVGALSAVAARGFRDAHEAAQAIFGLIHELVGLRICVLTQVDLTSDTLHVRAALDLAGLGIQDGLTLPASEMPCDLVVRSATPVCELDLDLHPSFRALPLRAKLGLRSYIGVPLRRSDGSVYGTLAATDTTVHEVTDDDLHVLNVLSRIAMYELECEERRLALEAQTKLLAEQLAIAEELETERVHTARLEAVLEAAAAVSHEVNNPLTVLQLRLGRLQKHPALADAECAEHLDVALEAAGEINQVTVRLRGVVNPISTHYLSGRTRMLDLAASSRSPKRSDS